MTSNSLFRRIEVKDILRKEFKKFLPQDAMKGQAKENKVYDNDFEHCQDVIFQLIWKVNSECMKTFLECLTRQVYNLFQDLWNKFLFFSKSLKSYQKSCLSWEEVKFRTHKSLP